MVTEGQPSPDFSLPSDQGNTVKLSTLKGKPVVVYFYPRDDTPGCTTEAKDFSCLVDEFAKAGATIIGISADTVASHAKFRKKHDLTVELVADEDKAAANAFGVWVEKSMYGKKSMGIERATFLIDARGKIARVWRKVKVAGHAEDVLAAIKTLK